MSIASGNDNANKKYLKHQLVLLVVTVLGHGLKHTFNSAFFVLLPEIKSGLLLSNTQIGILSTFRGITGGLSNLPAGFLGDRFGDKRAAILGLSIIFLGIFAFLLGIATTFWMAVIAACLYGVAITFWHPSAIASLSREFADRRGFAIALHGTGGSVGETLGPVISGILIGLIGWRLILQWSLAPALIFGFLIWLSLRYVPTPSVKVNDFSEYYASLLALFRSRRLILILIFSAGFAGGQSTVLTFLPIYVDEAFSRSETTMITPAGFYMALAQVGGIITQPLMGYGSDKFGRKAILSPSLGILGVSMIGLIFVPEGVLFSIVVFVMGGFLFPLMAILLASAMDVVGDASQATTVSLVFGIGIIVSAYAPAVAGVMADNYGTQSAFILGSGMLLATSALSWVTSWNR